MSHTGAVWNALIRTHHITSRKKLSKLRNAAGANGVFVLLRSGGAPGIMYVQGTQEGVEEWVSAVQRLRYKDYHLASRPNLASREGESKDLHSDVETGFFETGSVKNFSIEMEQRGLLSWWRKAMGYKPPDESA